MRFAQLVIVPVAQARFELVEEFGHITDRKLMLFSVPNILTFGRLFLIPFIVICSYFDF